MDTSSIFSCFRFNYSLHNMRYFGLGWVDLESYESMHNSIADVVQSLLSIVMLKLHTVQLAVMFCRCVPASTSSSKRRAKKIAVCANPCAFPRDPIA